ncbi:MAG TPA: tRNA (N(6)-L-threonylcarbamoyladenosine(37)-C(2))-methylthiotransferase MtaB [Bacteroidetes bacterium]|mgnify:CR=1 FL=1|nr:tRNA (N(6)-L-threonylcarbamoyladenosine(37)-C(2))-methylthiotransferase MtaB [Bacteroidota bacterium]
MNRKIAFKTLGCRLNKYETEALASEFIRKGYELVPFHQKADAYVINTCTVTNQSDRKSRYEISRAARRNPSSAVIVTGCMANSAKEQLEKQGNITYVVDNEHKHAVFSLLEAHFRGETARPDTFEKDIFGFGVAGQTFHTRSFVKIQDGCDNFCTFCIIPFVRGRAASRPAQEILHNVQQVVGLGFREVVLTGVNIGRYHFEGVRFEQLIEKILELPGDFRLRISSMEPEGFTDHFFGLFSHPKLTPHLHLCLQSGSDPVLLRMRRMYTVAQFMEIIHKIRRLHPGFNFTTDIMVGFPGETDKDFEQTCRVVREAGFSHVHTFKYSVREGTRAARMEDQIPEKVKTARSEIIRAISRENRLAYLRSWIGKEQTVLTEKIRSKTGSGYGEHYIPVEIDLPGIKQNEFYRVVLTELQQRKVPVLTGKSV